VRYLSIDIETTGLDERNCQTLQFAAVYDDTSKILAEAPTINLLIKHELYSGEPFALALNRDIFETLANLPQYYGTHLELAITVGKLSALHQNHLVRWY
jgi:hypothetical protein